MGSPVRLVEARVQTKFLDIDVDDLALLLMEHENGAVSTLSTAWCALGEEGRPIVEVHGTEAALRIEARGNVWKRYTRAERSWEEQVISGWSDRPAAERGRAGHATFFAATFRALQTGAAMPITGEQARHNLAVIAAARRASEERRAVALDE